MFLEILNSCIVTKLKENPNLVYTLLHEKETIEELETNPKFQDIMFNVNIVSSKVILFVISLFNNGIQSGTTQQQVLAQ